MRRIRELPPQEQPRTRLQSAGAAALSDTELLAIILGTGVEGSSALDIAAALLAEQGSLGGIQRLGFSALSNRRGIGPAKAAQIAAALEIGRRLVVTALDERPQIRSPTDCAALLMVEMGHLEQEHLRVVCLDTKNRVQAIHTVYVGSVNTAAVRIGEIFREPIRRTSTSIILAHNHPSGDPTPSPEDVSVTRQVTKAGRLLDIELLDHLVIGAGRFTSMRERGLVATW